MKSKLSFKIIGHNTNKLIKGLVFTAFLLGFLYLLSLATYGFSYIPKFEENELNTLKIFVQIIGGAFIFYGLYLNQRRLKVNENQLRVNEEGNVTERFKNAIEQLGNKESSTVRLGAIYSLNRIANDSVKDQKSIQKIICTHLIDIAKGKQSNEIQSILDLFRENKIYEGELINLSGAKINNAIFEDINFSKSVSKRIEISNSRFTNVNFENSKIPLAKLHKCDFLPYNVINVKDLNSSLNNNLAQADINLSSINECNFYNVWFFKTRFHGAKFIKSNFNGCYLVEMQKQSGSIINSQFNNCLMHKSRMNSHRIYYTRFSKCEMEEILFDSSNITNSIFIDTNLKKSNFRSCKLQGTIFKNVNLDGSNFEYTDLQNTQFLYSNLTGILWDNSKNIKLADFKGSYCKLKYRMKSDRTILTKKYDNF